MIAVISEVWPHPDRRADYFRLAEELLPHLVAVDGFISSERFESCSEPGKYLSVSTWRDEAALARWSNLAEHRAVMQLGRDGVLTDYRIRATQVLRDYGIAQRDGAPLAAAS